MLENSKWIKCVGLDCAVVRRAFVFDSDVSGAKIAVCGLGFYELRLNGRKVSQDLFTPVLSDYHHRTLDRLNYPIHDKFSHRIYYNEYDITKHLIPGENVMEIEIGNGWYRQKERIAEGYLSFGDELLCIYDVEITGKNGARHIVSDGEEVYYPSHITYSNLFLGETVDAREIDKPKNPRPVELLDPDKINSPLVKQTCPPDRLIRTVTPALLWESPDGRTKIYDTGENISGWVSLDLAGKCGDSVSLRFSEELREPLEDSNDVALDFFTTGSHCTCSSGKPQIQEDLFISDGTPRHFSPKFVWHAFRYFEITANPAESDANTPKSPLPEVSGITVEVIHTDAPVTSSFESDSEALNWLYDAFIRTQLGNMHAGVPSDCPHRERLGYTGDGQLVSPAAMLLLESREFYEKWIDDIRDCQGRDSGHVQHTAPFMGGGGGPGGWGSAIVFVPYNYCKIYGDKAMAEKCLPNMMSWVRYMRSRCDDGLIVREEDGGWCLGDWASLGKVEIPAPYVNTCLFIKAMDRILELTEILGSDDYTADVKNIRTYMSESAESVKRHYYDSETGSFCGGIQGADALAVYAGVGCEQRTLDNLFDKYNTLGIYDTGFILTDIMTEVMIRNFGADVAFKLMTTEEKGSYLWMKRHGATTIYEYMHGSKSHNHPMFGAPVRQLFEGFAGVSQARGDIGFKKITVSPQIPKGLSRFAVSVNTAAGRISLSYISGEFTVTIPDGIDAEFNFAGHSQNLTSGKNVITII